MYIIVYANYNHFSVVSIGGADSLVKSFVSDTDAQDWIAEHELECNSFKIVEVK